MFTPRVTPANGYSRTELSWVGDALAILFGSFGVVVMQTKDDKPIPQLLRSPVSNDASNLWGPACAHTFYVSEG